MLQLLLLKCSFTTIFLIFYLRCSNCEKHQLSGEVTLKVPPEYPVEASQEDLTKINDMDDKTLKRYNKRYIYIDTPFFRRHKLWRNAIVPYYIDVNSYSDKVLRDRIRSFLSNVNSVTPLRFMELPSPPKDKTTRYVFFMNRQGLLDCADHSSTYLTAEGVQKVTLGYECMSTGGELAEAVLAIAGVPAQHNAPDRDDYIKVIEENILPGKKHLFEKVKKEDWIFTKMKADPVDYDFLSAGHYHSHKYSSNGRATIELQIIPASEKRRSELTLLPSTYWPNTFAEYSAIRPGSLTNIQYSAYGRIYYSLQVKKILIGPGSMGRGREQKYNHGKITALLNTLSKSVIVILEADYSGTPIGERIGLSNVDLVKLHWLYAATLKEKNTTKLQLPTCKKLFVRDHSIKKTHYSEIHAQKKPKNNVDIPDGNTGYEKVIEDSVDQLETIAKDENSNNEEDDGDNNENESNNNEDDGDNDDDGDKNEDDSNNDEDNEYNDEDDGDNNEDNGDNDEDNGDNDEDNGDNDEDNGDNDEANGDNDDSEDNVENEGFIEKAHVPSIQTTRPSKKSVQVLKNRIKYHKAKRDPVSYLVDYHTGDEITAKKVLNYMNLGKSAKRLK